jgi:two-component system chemotaxis sensor kinase CheA
LKLIEGLADQIASSDPSSQDSIVKIGMQVEKALDQVGGGDSPLVIFFQKVLQVLQDLFQGKYAQPTAMTGPLAASIREVESYLREEDAGHLKKANATLKNALAAMSLQGLAEQDSPGPDSEEAVCEAAEADESAETGAETADPAASEPADAAATTVTPDTVAARLLAADPSDQDELKEIRNLIARYIGRDDLTAEQRARGRNAGQMLGEILSGNAEDPQARLAQIGEMIGGDGASGETPAEAGEEPEADTPAESSEDAEGREAAPVTAPAAESDEDPAAAAAAAAVKEAVAEVARFLEEPQLLPADTDGELLREFVVESLDHISAGEASLLALESDPTDTDQINVVFRAFHTIKGTSAFLGLNCVQKCAHLAENLLDRARDGEIRISGGYADLALKSCDALRQMLEGLEGLQPGDALFIPETLGGLLADLSNPDAVVAGEAESQSARVGDILVAEGKASREDIERIASEDPDTPIGEKLVASKVTKAGDVAQALRTQNQIRQSSGTGSGEASIRVSTNRLDNLINMVGELVIAQSMVAQDPDVLSGSRPRLSRAVSHAGKIIRELQDLSMSLRMVPLKNTFQKMARLVRDLAKKNNKKVQFVTEGEDTEIDRNMVEKLNDPLVHMIRNALDHGLETAEDRVAAGKGEQGTCTIRAYHSAGNVVIEIADDGKGMDRSKIVKKAVERGLIDSGKDLNDAEAFGLIFQPGFSTAEKITDVSGRGVGMDVVKRNIEEMRGRIEVQSRLGEGSRFLVRLPLTMAITDGMLLGVGKERYLLPTVSIEQSFRPEPGTINTVVGRGEVCQLRGELLPVFRLHTLYEIDDALTDPYDGLLVVIEGGGKRCALMVDELLGQQQVVIKSLGQSLRNIPGLAGGAILGDGRVGLILDASGLIKLAHGHGEDEQVQAA